jgi:hypothetical protein
MSRLLLFFNEIHHPDSDKRSIALLSYRFARKCFLSSTQGNEMWTFENRNYLKKKVFIASYASCGSTTTPVARVLFASRPGCLMIAAQRRNVQNPYNNIFTVKLQHLAGGMWTIKDLSGQTDNGSHDPYKQE